MIFTRCLGCVHFKEDIMKVISLIFIFLIGILAISAIVMFLAGAVKIALSLAVIFCVYAAVELLVK